MTYMVDPRVDGYIGALPDWQQEICREVRDLVHAADPEGIITAGHDNTAAPAAGERSSATRRNAVNLVRDHSTDLIVGPSLGPVNGSESEERGMLRFVYGARSHVGLVRENNEDSGFAGPYLQLVADGVGGAASGEVASATTAYVMSALAATGTHDDLLGLLASAVQESHSQLAVGVERDQSRRGMATTLTAVVADGDRFAMVHIGDSRGYLLRGGRFVQLTSDHTFVQALVDEGRLTRDQVASYPHRSVVLKCLDGEHRPEPDVFSLDLQAGDRVLLCSDGLSDFLPEDGIVESLHITDRDVAVSTLINAALERGGRDNVTCLIADVEDGPVICRDGMLLGAMRDPYLVVDPAAVRLSRPA